jgi:Domain of unknown function (DUF4136)
MRIKSTYWVCLLLAPVLLAGCYPKGAEYADDLDLVYTNYASGTDFSSRKTYALPDSVIKITGEDVPDSNYVPQFLTTSYASVILASIKQNMDGYGWTEVDKNADPDVILLVSTMTTTNIYYYYDWSYWDWWYPGWSYWGWYYPGYYYPAYVTGYRSGSVFVQMVDSKVTRGAVDNVPVLWNSILNGLAEGNSSNITARLQTNIGKAFIQSPYLKH